MAIKPETRGMAETAKDPDAVTVANRFQKPKNAGGPHEVNVSGAGDFILGVSEHGTDAAGDFFALRKRGHFTVDAPSQTIVAGTFCMPGAAGIAVPYAVGTPPDANYAVLAKTPATGGATDQIIVDLDNVLSNPDLLP